MPRGRPPGRKNKPVEERVAEALTKERVRLAKSGVPLEPLVPPMPYTPTIKPGERDLTDRFARVQEAIDLIAELKQVKADRAAHPAMEDVPGGKTGLVTFTYAKDGPESYAKVSRLEPALVSGIVENLTYIGRELGQFAPDGEVALNRGKGAEKKPVNYSCLSNEDFAEYRRIALILHADREGKRVVNSVIEDELPKSEQSS
jgi:hypothetical protein